MNEYIEREALKEAMNSLWCHYSQVCNIHAELATENCIELVEEAHTADVVEVKRGRWIWDERFHDYTCSECHNWDLKTPNFCSNCGADMRGERRTDHADHHD